MTIHVCPLGTVTLDIKDIVAFPSSKFSQTPPYETEYDDVLNVDPALKLQFDGYVD